MIAWRGFAISAAGAAATPALRVICDGGLAFWALCWIGRGAPGDWKADCMDGKENENANGAGAAEAAGQDGADGAQAAASQVGAGGGASGAGAKGAEPAKAAAPAASAGSAGSGRREGAAKPSVDYAAEIARRDSDISERDGRIAELEGKLADAEKRGELAESLKAEVEQLKTQAASDRVDFALQLAGCRNVKAARAVLDDYDGDVEALKAAEPWLFAAHAAEATGATGLPNAGAADDGGKRDRHWRKLVGLSPKKDE